MSAEDSREYKADATTSKIVLLGFTEVFINCLRVIDINYGEYSNVIGRSEYMR